MSKQQSYGLKGHKALSPGQRPGNGDGGDFALKGQKHNPRATAFALSGRIMTADITQGAALGYGLTGLSGRSLSMQGTRTQSKTSAKKLKHTIASQAGRSLPMLETRAQSETSAKKLKHTIASLSFILLAGMLTACTDRPHDAKLSRELPPIVPDYTGVTIPAGIAPLNFYAADEEAELLDVSVSGSKGPTLHANGRQAIFDIDQWHALTRQHRGDSLTVSVSIRRDGQWTQYRPFAIYVSADTLGQWGLTYRLIPPGYENYGGMGIYQRCLATFEQTPIVENGSVDRQCMNCHTTNRTNPDQWTLHMRGQHGATLVTNGGEPQVLAGRNDELGGGMVYPYWHPEGRFIAYSTNDTHQRFHQLAGRRVEVYDDKADIIIYDTQSHTIVANSLVGSTRRLENFPAFSPDGQWLYYCSAASVDSIWKNYSNVRYDICRVGFNAADGTLRGEPEVVVQASSKGRSAVMPRLSYDGRHLLYTVADYGCFPIWHPEADLWMKDLQSGEEWPLEEANSDDADSFHNWSVNSRWMVFTSRRGDGLFTQLYLAHVDEHGRAAKAFRLPQKNPREFDRENIYSFNTPDFATRRLEFDRQGLYRRILSDERIATQLKRR